MGSSSKPKSDPNADAINALTLKRLQREEADLEAQTKERYRLLDAGRTGRSSLLSAGFTGPKAGDSPIEPLAVTRMREMERNQIPTGKTRNTGALKNRQKTVVDKKMLPGYGSPISERTL